MPTDTHDNTESRIQDRFQDLGRHLERTVADPISTPRSLPVHARRSPGRRRALVAAMVLLASGTGIWMANRTTTKPAVVSTLGGGTASTPTDMAVRPFVATDLPNGVVPAGAGRGSGGMTTPNQGPTLLLGPSADEPTVGIKVQLGTPEGSGTRRVQIGGRTIVVLDPHDPQRGSVAESRGDRSVYVFSTTDAPAALAALARDVQVDGLQASIAPADLPDGIRLLGELPGDVLPGSEQADAFGYTVSYASENLAAGPVVSVSSSSGDVAQLNALRLQIPNVRSTTVRGHPALLFEPPVPASTDLTSTGTRTRGILTWVERPGELLQVTAYGDLSVDQLRRAAETVRPVDAPEWERIALGDYRLDVAGTTTLGSGRFVSGIPWVLRWVDDDGSGERGRPSPTFELEVVTDDVRTNRGSGMGSENSAPGVFLLGGGGLSQGGRQFAYGPVGRAVHEVRMLKADGSPGPAVAMVRSDEHPAWVAELPDYSARFTLVATDAAGTELGRTTIRSRVGR